MIPRQPSPKRPTLVALAFTLLPRGRASDEVATLEPHTINADTDKNFCDLCVNRVPEGGESKTEPLHAAEQRLAARSKAGSMWAGVSGCRAEFYTNERLKKCGVTVGAAAVYTSLAF